MAQSEKVSHRSALLSLPDELLISIFCHLDYSDIARLQQTNKRLEKITRSNRQLWRNVTKSCEVWEHPLRLPSNMASVHELSRRAGGKLQSYFLVYDPATCSVDEFAEMLCTFKTGHCLQLHSCLPHDVLAKDSLILPYCKLIGQSKDLRVLELDMADILDLLLIMQRVIWPTFTPPVENIALKGVANLSLIMSWLVRLRDNLINGKFEIVDTGSFNATDASMGSDEDSYNDASYDIGELSDDFYEYGRYDDLYDEYGDFDDFHDYGRYGEWDDDFGGYYDDGWEDDFGDYDDDSDEFGSDGYDNDDFFVDPEGNLPNHLSMPRLKELVLHVSRSTDGADASSMATLPSLELPSLERLSLRCLCYDSRFYRSLFSSSIVHLSIRLHSVEMEKVLCAELKSMHKLQMLCLEYGLSAWQKPLAIRTLGQNNQIPVRRLCLSFDTCDYDKVQASLVRLVRSRRKTANRIEYVRVTCDCEFDPEHIKWLKQNVKEVKFSASIPTVQD